MNALGLKTLGCLLIVATGITAMGCNGNGPAAASQKGIAAQTATTESSPAIRVRVATAEIAPLGGSITVPGVVHPFQKAMIAAKVPGRVVQRLAEPGDTVAKGDLASTRETARKDLCRSGIAPSPLFSFMLSFSSPSCLLRPWQSQRQTGGQATSHQGLTPEA